MFVPTIYQPEIDSKVQKVTIENSKLHHLKKVLRIKDYDRVNVSNGTGQLFLGQLVNDNVEINSLKNYERKESLTVFVPYLREKSRFRFMIEKLVELGVTRLFIGKTQNTQNTNIDYEKIQSWAISALEQSGTPFFPQIVTTESIDYSIFDTCFDLTGSSFTKDSPKPNTFAIGPEGGWSPEELLNFKYIYKISDFSLRTETAAISAVSLML